MSDTIYALSSGRGMAGVAVIRVSGPGVREAIKELCGRVPDERVASLLTIAGSGGAVIDRGICLYFRGPQSFTGEDVGEFHVHGGRAVVGALLGALSRMRGFRAAVAGEFTRRAFANGKLDLVEVEALGDILAAETEGQLRLAQRVAGGELSRRVGQWRDELVSVLARVEASIDFADEDDVGEEADLTLLGRVEAVQGAIEDVLDDKGRGERLREGVTVVIAGPPNAGKSSLLNVLAKREAAIVSPFPGTTRDPIEVHLDLGGVPVMLVDTAGLRETGEAVETIGVERARERISRAEFVLWLEPVDGAVGVPEPGGSRVWPVTTKVDLADHVPENKLSVSAVSGAGIAELIEELTRKVKEVAGDGEDVLISRVRQREELESCAAELRGYLEACSGGAGAELEAEHLRLALRALGRMTGQVDVEELLGEIFAAFCIGK